jgi:hypothetical protein
MKKIVVLVLFFATVIGFSQEKDSTEVVYKKRVLESIEVDFLMSYYKQDGIHSAVSGGKGMEELTNLTPTFVVAIPLNDDDVLTVDAGLSAYTSASSGNINPFDSNTPSPWQASSGASAQDVLTSLSLNYNHSSDDRNTIWNGHISGSVEYDYSSLGFGGGVSRLFNGKNSEVSLAANVYLDTWTPIYPKELADFSNYGLSGGIYDDFTIIPGQVSSEVYNPLNYKAHTQKNRNSYALSLGFSQVFTKKVQGSFFLDILYQNGLLSTPYQRVYFADKGNFFINEFQLADDIERLPNARFKLPIATRWNFYLNEKFTLRTYYRYYFDNWAISSHTLNIELPYKLSEKFTVIPMYRFYSQEASKYFAPYETHLSTEKFYTSDYDLSKFNANQYGFGLSYIDIFTNARIWEFGLKNVDFRFNHYERNDGLSADIVSLGFKFVQQ